MSFFQGKRPVKRGYPEKAGTRDVRRSVKYPQSDKTIARNGSFHRMNNGFIHSFIRFPAGFCERSMALS